MMTYCGSRRDAHPWGWQTVFKYLLLGGFPLLKSHLPQSSLSKVAYNQWLINEECGGRRDVEGSDVLTSTWDGSERSF